MYLQLRTELWTFVAIMGL